MGGVERTVEVFPAKIDLFKIKDDWLPTTLKPLNMEEIKPDDYVKFLDYKEDTAFRRAQLKLNKEVNLGVKYFNSRN